MEELWESMCHTAAGLITAALPEVDNAESLLKIKNLVALFMQAMDVSFPFSLDVQAKTHYLSRRGISQLRFSTNFFLLFSEDMPICSRPDLVTTFKRLVEGFFFS